MAMSDIYKGQYGLSQQEINRRYHTGEENINRATAEANKMARTNLATSGFAGGRTLAFAGAQVGANRLRALSTLNTDIMNESDAYARQQKSAEFGAMAQEELGKQQHGYQLEYMSEEQKNVLARMSQQQKYDLIKIAQQFENDKDLMTLQKELNKRGWGSILGTIAGAGVGALIGGIGMGLGAKLVGGGGGSSSGGGDNYTSYSGNSYHGSR